MDIKPLIAQSMGTLSWNVPSRVDPTKLTIVGWNVRIVVCMEEDKYCRKAKLEASPTTENFLEVMVDNEATTMEQLNCICGKEVHIPRGGRVPKSWIHVYLFRKDVSIYENMWRMMGGRRYSSGPKGVKH